MALIDDVYHEYKDVKVNGIRFGNAIPFKISMDVWNVTDQRKFDDSCSKLYDMETSMNHDEFKRLTFDSKNIPIADWGSFDFPLSRPPYANICFNWEYTLTDDLYNYFKARNPDAERARTTGLFIDELQLKTRRQENVVWLLNEDMDDKFIRYSLIQWRPRLMWIHPPQIDEAPVSVFKDFETSRMDFYQEKNSWKIDLAETYIKSIDGYPILTPGSVKHIYLHTVYICMKLCSIINCANIIKVKHQIPDNINRKRKNNGKKELISYYTLLIRPVTKKYQQDKRREHALPAFFKSADETILRRVHLVRGHFKRYSKEKPLFGKYEGLYWWQAHARGEKKVRPLLRKPRNPHPKKEGMIVKDYCLISP